MAIEKKQIQQIISQNDRSYGQNMYCFTRKKNRFSNSSESVFLHLNTKWNNVPYFPACLSSSDQIFPERSRKAFGESPVSCLKRW